MKLFMKNRNINWDQEPTYDQWASNHSAEFILTTMCRQTSNAGPLKQAKHKQKSADSLSVSEGKQAWCDLQADPSLPNNAWHQRRTLYHPTRISYRQQLHGQQMTGHRSLAGSQANNESRLMINTNVWRPTATFIVASSSCMWKTRGKRSFHQVGAIVALLVTFLSLHPAEGWHKNKNLGRKEQSCGLGEWFAAAHPGSWISGHWAWSVSRAALRVSSPWQLPLGPRNILAVVVLGVAGDNYSPLPCDTPDKLKLLFKF